MFVETILCLTNGLLILWVVVLKMQIEQIKHDGVVGTGKAAATPADQDPASRPAAKGMRRFSIDE